MAAGADDAMLNVLLTDKAALVIQAAVCLACSSPLLGTEAVGSCHMNDTSLCCDATYSQHNVHHSPTSVQLISI